MCPSSSHTSNTRTYKYTTSDSISASRKLTTKVQWNLFRFLKHKKVFGEIDSIKVELFGSLALTGEGHGTPIAIKLGLLNYAPDEVKQKQLIEVDSLDGEIKLGGIL